MNNVGAAGSDLEFDQRGGGGTQPPIHRGQGYTFTILVIVHFQPLRGESMYGESMLRG